MKIILTGLFGDDGGLIRVRSVLAFAFTGIGGAYMLINQALPPDGFMVLWGMTVAFYFAVRATQPPVPPPPPPPPVVPPAVGER